MQRVSEIYAPRGLVVITIAVDPKADAVTAFVRERRIRLPITPDPDGTLQARLGMWGHPSFVFVDRRGEIVGTAIGYRDWLSPNGRAFVDAFTAGPTP